MPSSSIPVNFYIGKFPKNFYETPLNFFKAFLRRLRITITGLGTITGNLIPGFTNTNDAAPPAFNAGPWWHQEDGGGRWLAWDDATAQYGQLSHKLGDKNFTITLLPDPNGITNIYNGVAYIYLTLPETADISSGGDLALNLLDVYVPRETILLTEPSADVNGVVGDTTPEILFTNTSYDDYDGTSSDDYLLRLSGDTTFTLTGPNNGQIKTITIENNGTDYTVTWPAAVKWTGGTEPTQPVGGATGSEASKTAVGIYVIRKINGALFGELIDQTPSLPVPSVPTGGSTDIPNTYIPDVERRKFPY